MSNSQIPSDELERTGFLSRRFPRLEREERCELSLRIAGGALADTDFVMMMALSATLASLGLLSTR